MAFVGILLTAISLVVYIGFCIITFDIYSKKKEKTNPFHLLFIFIYYSLLMIYVLQIAFSGTELFVQICLFLIFSSIISFNYYKNIIVKRENGDYNGDVNSLY